MITEQVSKTLEELVAFVKEASPMMWEAAHQKVQADILGCLIGMGFVTVLTVFSWWAMWMVNKRVAAYDKGAPYIVSGLVTLASLIIGSLCLTEAVKLHIARDWYAIQQLATLLPGS